MTKNDNSFSRSGQKLAINLLARYIRAPAKAEIIRESVDKNAHSPDEERRAHRLYTACLRNLILYRFTLSDFVAKKPSPEIEAVLLLALCEIDLQKNGAAPPIIDSWVGLSQKIGGKKSSGFANAVLRKASLKLSEIRAEPSSIPIWILTSHPEWMVKRWIQKWGHLEAERIVRWNQETPAIYASGISNNPEEEGLATSRWPDFYYLKRGFTASIHEGLATGRLTIRDPATRIAVQMLESGKPDRVLDLCASPGGKSRALLSGKNSPTTLVAADLPDRIQLLQENLAPWEACATVVEIDLNHESSFPAEWATGFDGVLLDSPCSNTGVLRRKPDTKYRLRPEDLEQLPILQLKYLKIASRFTKPGGVLVYSTCSLEPEENRGVARAFLESPEGLAFEMTGAISALPSRSAHDGAAAYRFKRAMDR